MEIWDKTNKQNNKDLTCAGIAIGQVVTQTSGRAQTLLGASKETEEVLVLTNGIVPKEKGYMIRCEIWEELRFELRPSKSAPWYT